MSERDKIIVVFNFCFILLYSFLILAQCHTERQIKKMDAKQAEINQTAWEKTERMDKELRLLSQDIQIHDNLLLNQTFIQEDDQ
jgi:hypothetical protein